MRNIILLTYDSLRADHCSYMGYDRQTTPHLDEMDENGITFKNAIAPASRTNPSMAGMLTGEPLIAREEVANGVSRAHLDRHETIAEKLSKQGYTTGAFCPNAYASRYFGFDIGFDQFQDFMFDTGLYQRLFDQHLSDSGIFTTIRNLRNFIRREEAFKTWDTYIDQIETWVRNQSDPFFLWIFSLDTHFPYLAPRKYRKWGNLFSMYYYNWRCNQWIDQIDIDLDDHEKQKIIDIYDDSIFFADQLIGELKDRLSDFDPIFVVHGDHGESFDEHGFYGHFYPTLYEENIHVPLVIGDQKTDPATYERPFSLFRLPELIDGLSETGTYSPKKQVDNEYVFASDYDGHRNRKVNAIRTDRMKYIVTRHGDRNQERELYDLRNDPTEQMNLINGDDDQKHQTLMTLNYLERRQYTHEREKLAIRDSVSELMKTEKL